VNMSQPADQPADPLEDPDPSAQLPAVIPPGAVAVAADAELRLIPTLIANAGAAAGWRYVEFFTANIRNPNTRRAYARACARFFAWCARMMSPRLRAPKCEPLDEFRGCRHDYDHGSRSHACGGVRRERRTAGAPIRVALERHRV
jgi:hypothetical protein